MTGLTTPPAAERQSDALAADPVPTVRVTDRAGLTQDLVAVEGWTLYEILREHGLKIDSICDGTGVCGQCHIALADGWFERLPPAREEEEQTLDGLPTVGPRSRLACQIVFDTRLDGIAFTLQPLPQ